MAKIGIYIPESMAPEIEKWEKELNFSELFRDAFRRAVDLHQSLSQIGDSEMKATIERLKREQQDDYQSGEEQGLKDGVLWANDNGSLGDITRICKDGIEPMDLDELLEPWDESAVPYLDELISKKHVERDSFRAGYAKGFWTGVESVWDKIKAEF